MWLRASESITSMGWCTYLMHWHMECWVNTFFIGLSVSPWRPCSQSLFCHNRGIITPPPLLSLSPFLSLIHFPYLSRSATNLFLSHFLANLVFILLFCVKYQQPSLVAAVSHLSLLAVMSALIVSVWWRRCCLWTDDLIDFVLRWAKWQWWTDGWVKRLWFQPRMSHTKPETASALAQPIVSPAAASYSPSARTEHDLARAVILILQSWCMWGTLWNLTTLAHLIHCWCSS